VTAIGFRAEIVSTPRDPASGDPEAVRYEADGLLVVEDGTVADRGDYRTLAPRYPGLAITAFPDRLITPGFVDAHVHYPQAEQIAAYGSQLLDWLERHIFPAEAAFADPIHARAQAELFLDELLRNGTTSALVFATVHAESVDALFEAALERDMRLITGKVLMDRGPEGLRDTAEEGEAATQDLIARWRGRGRLGYAITPRFAITSSPEQLAGAGRLLAAHPDVLLHTHLAETQREIAEVATLYPEARDYLDAYARFGLVGPRSVFAHAIHLNHDAMGRLGRAGAAIAFCPTSNLFLGSGLFDLELAHRCGVCVGVGTDVGAGTSFSMLHTLGEAYKVGQLRGATLDPMRALYMATAGGAQALGIQSKVGALEIGQEADFLVLDPASTPLLARRTTGADIRDKLFALQILGDDRAISQTYVKGRRAHARDADPALGKAEIDG
jgi:guanine deaminase